MPSTVTFSGAGGNVSVEGVAVASITAWTLTVKCDTREVTDSNSSTNSEFIPEGHTQWEGTFEGWVADGTVTNTIGAATSATTLVLTMASGHTFTGDAVLTAKTMSLQVKGTDAVKVAYSFQCHGTLTEANA